MKKTTAILLTPLFALILGSAYADGLPHTGECKLEVSVIQQDYGFLHPKPESSDMCSDRLQSAQADWAAFINCANVNHGRQATATATQDQAYFQFMTSKYALPSSGYCGSSDLSIATPDLSSR